MLHWVIVWLRNKLTILRDSHIFYSCGITLHFSYFSSFLVSSHASSQLLYIYLFFATIVSYLTREDYFCKLNFYWHTRRTIMLVLMECLIILPWKWWYHQQIILTSISYLPFSLTLSPSPIFVFLLF